MSLADFQSGNLRSSSGDLRPRHFAITRWRLDRIFFFCAFENFNWAVPLVQTAHGCRKQSVLYERQVGARTRSYSENWHTPQRRFTRSVESCTCTGRNGVTTPIGKPVFFCFCWGRFSTTRVLTKTIGCCFGLPVKNGKQQQHQRKKWLFYIQTVKRWIDFHHLKAYRQ